MNDRVFIHTVVIAIFFLAACVDSDQENTLKISKEQVEQLIKDGLSQGDSQSKIEQFLVDQGIVYSYDKYSSRYQGIIRDVSKESNFDQAIVIHIYVDDEKRFLDSEVRYSYTAP